VDALTDREFLMLVRAALLLFVDAIEQKLGIPRTKDLRERVKRTKIEGAADAVKS
jgi:hypothetical protein